MKFKCKGGQGCETPGCEFITGGDPAGKMRIQPPYTCPWNHWRAAAWEKVEDTTT